MSYVREKKVQPSLGFGVRGFQEREIVSGGKAGPRRKAAKKGGYGGIQAKPAGLSKAISGGGKRRKHK